MLRTAPLLAACILAGFLAGCATPPAGPEALAGAEDPLRPAAAEPIGLVVFVDPADEVAIVEVASARTRIAPVLITRNEALVETARLEPTRFQRGRTLGTRIVSGLPNVGDEVIVGQE